MSSQPSSRTFIILVAIVLIAAAIYFACTWVPQSKPMDESAAIAAVKAQHSDLKSYPSDQLPPKSITTEQEGDTWYIAFIQNGSGQPIISARCFSVTSDGKVTQTGTYVPTGINTQLSISAKTCD